MAKKYDDEQNGRTHSPEAGRGKVACHQCGAENLETFVFCASCGTRLSRLCPYCKEIHHIFVTVCPRTGEPVPQEGGSPDRGKRVKKALAVSVGALALAGSLVLLAPRHDQNSTTYTYPPTTASPVIVVSHTPDYPCCKYAAFIPDKLTPSPKLTPMKASRPEEPFPCSEYAVFIPHKNLSTPQSVKDASTKNTEAAPRYAVIIPKK